MLWTPYVDSCILELVDGVLTLLSKAKGVFWRLGGCDGVIV